MDAQARAVAPKLSEVLGVPVVVENKPGGGTLVAANEVLKAAPDGHTIFYSASSTLAQNPHTSAAVTYNPLTDFTPLSLGARGPLVIVISSKLPVASVQELVAYGKANPGKLSYASFGTGTSSHIFGQVFAQNAGIEMEHIPYKGGAELAADLFEGRVQVAFDAAPSGIKNAATGRAKIIAVAAPERSSLLPDVPTVTEQGVKGLDTTSFLGWFGPARMAPEVVQQTQRRARQGHCPAGGAGLLQDRRLHRRELDAGAACDRGKDRLRRLGTAGEGGRYQEAVTRTLRLSNVQSPACLAVRAAVRARP